VAILLGNDTASPPDLVARVLVEGLQRLEYRGYDSAGVALVDGNRLRVIKRQGKVSALKEALAGDLKGDFPQVRLGLAHTRWATHGPPSERNAHPHVSVDGDLAVVHNGIVENHSVLRKHLQAEGYVFKSETDTEVLAHLIRYVQAKEPELAFEDAVALALTQVNGAYGIVVVDAKHPGLMVGARRGSPLLVGFGANCVILASDAAALVGKATRVMYLEDEDLFVARLTTAKPSAEDDPVLAAMGIEYEIRSTKVTESDAAAAAAVRPASSAHLENDDSMPPSKAARTMSVLDRDLARHRHRRGMPEKAVRDMHALELSLEKIEKGGYKHFMIKEIMEQPSVLRDCMRGRLTDNVVKLGGLSDHWERIKNARRIIITACGTSWHSAQVGEYMIESLAKIPVEVEYASEFRYRNPIIHKDDVVIVISQSGETADTLEAAKISKLHGALTLGFVNVVGSSIARITDAGVFLHVGPEIGVASTKAFSGQVMILALFAVQLGLAVGKLSDERANEIVAAIKTVPDAVERVLCPETIKFVQDMSKTYRYANNFLFLGRGMNFPVALEGALKLKEISYVHAEGYPAAELKHGPIALIDRQMPVIIIAPRFDPTYAKVKGSIEEVVARSGSVIVITDEGNNELDGLAEFVIRVPKVDEFCSPFVTVVPLQLIAYEIALLRGCAIDMPRNLAKSVTVE